MEHAYKVKLDTFEGPLDLLLHLVNQLEIDINDIPVAEITDQYMTYIRTMQEIELNIASEYLVMAATLLAIKSSTLLPKKELVIEDDEYEEDLREELIQRLIEYRKYKEAASLLKNKELEENQIYTRPQVQFDEDFGKTPVIRGDVSIYQMIHALHYILERREWNKPLQTTINRVEISIEDRMDEIMNLVNALQEDRISFHDLFPYPNRSHIVTTFLALLQLLKNNSIQCEQKNHFQPIFIQKVGV